MLRHVLFLFFLYGIKLCSSSSGGEAQEQTIDTKDVSQNGIKKNGLGANGLEPNWEKVLGNFRNPVLEYLLHANSDRANAPPKRGGVIREIRHSQTLLMPSPLGAPLPPLFTNQLPQFESLKTPGGEGTRNPDRSPVDNFWNYLRNKTQAGGNKTFESVVTSPVLHLSREGEESREETRIQTYPAVAVVINTFDKDGSLKKSVTHFQPDFNSLAPVRGASHVTVGSNANEIKNKVDGNQERVKNPGDGGGSGFPGGSSRQGLQWPLAGYFPIVINDPFLSVYNAFATSMYNAVSSMVEYGPAADVCSREGEGEGEKGEGLKGVRERSPVVGGEAEGDVFGEVTMRSEKLRRIEGRPSKGVERRKRDATSILVKSREGDVVNITLEEPADVNSRKVPEGTDLILRKGGIAIAGPGGAATAYTGGTAIVGPYGTVYKSPEGTAILGPFSKVVDITDNTSFEQIIKMHKEMQSQKPDVVVQQQEGGRNFQNFRNIFSYLTSLPIKFEVKPKGRSFSRSRPKVVRLREEGVMAAIKEIRETEFGKIAEDTPYEERGSRENQTTLVFRPKSKAEAGRNGIALSAPTSHAILYPGQKAHIYFEPESVASAGPSGFAHAHSDLFVTYVRNDTTLERPGNPAAVED